MLLVAGIAVSWSLPAAVLASPHATNLQGAVFVADRGNAVVVGERAGKIRLARLDRYGRPGGLRTLGNGDASDSLDVALAGNHVAAAWLSDETLVLARTSLHGGPVQIERLRGRGIAFHAIAVNDQGVVLDVFKDAPDFDPTGVSGFLARPGEPGRLIEVATITDDNRNSIAVSTDAGGGFHVSWQSDRGYDIGDNVLGRADADAIGVFAPAVEQDLNRALYYLDVGTAADGSQVAAFIHGGRLMTTRRAPGGAWSKPRANGRVGAGTLALAVAPSGAAIVAYAPLGGPFGPGTVRALVIAKSGASRTVTIGKGYLEGVIADRRDRARVVWVTGGPTRVRASTVYLGFSRQPQTRTIARDCFGTPESEVDSDNRVAGDTAGRLTVGLVCGRSQRSSVIRSPGP